MNRVIRDTKSTECRNLINPGCKSGLIKRKLAMPGTFALPGLDESESIGQCQTGLSGCAIGSHFKMLQFNLIFS
jgi:hypothetical protein